MKQATPLFGFTPLQSRQNDEVNSTGDLLHFVLLRDISPMTETKYTDTSI